MQLLNLVIETLVLNQLHNWLWYVRICINMKHPINVMCMYINIAHI